MDRASSFGRPRLSFFVEFQHDDPSAYARLDAVIRALAAAKATGDFANDERWTSLFAPGELAWFTPVHEATRDNSPGRWDFGSMLDAFANGEYRLLGLRSVGPDRARLEFEPIADPYGGTGCMRALIEAFGFRVLRVEG